TLSDIRKEIHSLDFVLSGTIGQKSIDWAFATYALPSEFIVNPPLSLSQVRLTWQKMGARSFAGKVAVASGPVIEMDYYQNAEERGIRRAEIKDQDTSATITLKDRKTSFDFSFSGSLALETLNRIFSNRFFGNGKLTGTLQAAIGKDDPLESTAKGTLEGNDIVVPWGRSVPLRIDDFSLHADTKILTLDSVGATLGESHFSANGKVAVLADGFVVDIDVSADKLNVSEMQQALRPERKEVDLKKDEEPETGQTAGRLVRGVVRFNSSSVTFGRYTFSPVKAVALVGPAGVSAAITEASLCGISVPGEFSFSQGDMRLDFKPQIKDQQLGFSISCLTGLDVHISGTYNLNADISMQGKSGALVPSLEGNVDFKAKDGKIYRYPALAKILSVLSITEIFRGKVPEFGGSGFPYRSMAVKGNLHQGKLQLEKAYIGGSSLDIIAQGDVDFAGKQMDLVVLVAPFSTINWVIRHIPLVGKVMGGTLISIPVKVSGDLADPDVTFLAPSAVGTRLLNILENILELPVEIISPILPHKKEEQK
ncbi:MAG: AsmA-like C-terminal domain-containing protein, partial [Betaproteobacteria bacterium]